MADFENEYIKGKSLEELIDSLAGGVIEPRSPAAEATRAAIQAKLVQQLAKPQKWASVSLVAATVSALAAVGSMIAAFS
jgi:hypothetical protein